MKRLSWLGCAVFGLVGCADSVPVPDVFDAAFATGQVCIPSQIATGGSNTHYPVRFTYNLYDCVHITPGSVRILTVYQGQQMVMLATAELTKDTSVESTLGCDARDLESPPAGRYQMTTQDFNVTLPQFDGGTFATGPFVITIPYLTLEEGQRVMDRLEAGEDARQVISEEVGPQTYPGRQISVNFSETAEPVATPGDIAASDCHDIPLP